jgi:hypothetical protein
MIFTDTVGNCLFVAGIALLIFFVYYNGKYSYVLLFSAIGLIYSRFGTNEIVVLKANQEKEILLTFGSSIDYSFQDGASSNVSVSSNTLVNDTRDKLIVEKVEYSTYSSISSGNNIVNIIEPYSFAQLGSSVSFYFEAPPKTISVKGGGSTTRYWLHK